MTRRILGPAALGTLAAAVPAAAHGITGEATNLSIPGYVPLGIEHMLLGWDHLLFVFGIVLLAGAPVRAAKLISLFVAGHSLTLVVATLAEWRVSPTAVDVVIALSVVFVAALGLRGRPSNWTVSGAVILGFGLVHGLGLSTRLQDLGIPDDGLLAKTIAFNIGIEIGQLLAVALFVGLVWLLGRRAPQWPQIRRGAFGAMAVAGVVAAVVLAITGEDVPPAPAPAPASLSTSSCETVTQDAPVVFGGAHPDKPFYEPGEPAPEEDLGHVMGDGYVIVRYRPDLPAEQLAELREWVTSGAELPIVIAADPDLEEPVIAATLRRATRCSTFDGPAVKAFAEQWLADVRAGRVG